MVPIPAHAQSKGALTFTRVRLTSDVRLCGVQLEPSDELAASYPAYKAGASLSMLARQNWSGSRESNSPKCLGRASPEPIGQTRFIWVKSAPDACLSDGALGQIVSIQKRPVSDLRHRLHSYASPVTSGLSDSTGSPAYLRDLLGAASLLTADADNTKPPCARRQEPGTATCHYPLRLRVVPRFVRPTAGSYSAPIGWMSKRDCLPLPTPRRAGSMPAGWDSEQPR